MRTKPDFFLSATGEVTGDLATPRACWATGRLNDHIRDDHMLIEVEPPIIGQTYGLGGQDIANLILSTRYPGDTLFPVRRWPCHVYIARIMDDNVMRTPTFTKEQVEVIAWGLIFRTVEEASDSEGMR